jgi:hypothetical protein
MVSFDCYFLNPLASILRVSRCYATGPIFYLNLAGQPVIVLNSKKVAVDLLERRAANYSSRPRFIVSGEYLNGGCSMILAGYGDL